MVLVLFMIECQETEMAQSASLSRFRSGRVVKETIFALYLLHCPILFSKTFFYRTLLLDTT